MGGSIPPFVGPAGPVLRAAQVLSSRPNTGGLVVLELEVLDGPLRETKAAGVFYSHLGAAPRVGQRVVANTVGLEMGLGTGGVAVVLPASGGEAPDNRDHFVKLPYSPLQFPTPPLEQAEDLSGTPAVVLPLHSHLAPACCAVADLRPGSRVSFLWQEGGALAVPLSEVVRDLKEKALLHTVVSAGACFGGDVEAPNAYAGLLAAAAVSDVVLAGIGPGVVGTGAPYAHGGMSAATVLNAAAALAGDAVLAPRISGADPRDRHRGISHHTRAVLRAALGGCRVALPASARTAPISDLPARHTYLPVSYGASGLEARFGVTFESMGRSYKDDAVFFDAAAAAVSLALKEPAGDAE